MASLWAYGAEQLWLVPVVWLFSTSSGSIPFFSLLCTALWIICLGFGFKLIAKACLHLGMSSGFLLKVWMAVFTLVTLQLPTTLRPIIGKSDSILNFSEKKFFLSHWLEPNEATSLASEDSLEESSKNR